MHASHAELSQAFCSHCGYPPIGRWRSLTHRVCMRCEMGMVLRAPPGLAPRFYEPFVIVDADLRLQAVSRRAEADEQGIDPKEAMSLVALTQYMDTIRSVGEHGNMTTLLLPASPSAVGSLMDEVQQGILRGNLAAEATLSPGNGTRHPTPPPPREARS